MSGLIIRFSCEIRKLASLNTPIFRGPDKVCIFIFRMPISSPNPMFDHLLESSYQDDSNKWSNIGFGEEITQVESIEVHFTHLIWNSDFWMLSIALELLLLFISEKATSQLLLEPDWDSILQITDTIRQGDVQYVVVISYLT